MCSIGDVGMSTVGMLACLDFGFLGLFFTILPVKANIIVLLDLQICEPAYGA